MRSLALASAGGVALLLAAPALASAWQFLRGANSERRANRRGRQLLDPLSRLQLLGIWPAGDFRRQPPQLELTYLLLVLLAAAAGFALVDGGAAAAVGAAALLGGRGRRLGLRRPVRGGRARVAVADREGPCDGIALPAHRGAGGSGAPRRLGADALAGRGFVALAALAGGVLWSNTLAYGEVWLAPRGQLAELESSASASPAAGRR